MNAHTMPSPVVRVILIAGESRSGSTLLEQYLCRKYDVLGVGELRQLQRRGVIRNQACSCGAPFDACEIWSRMMSMHDVLSRAADAVESVTDPGRMLGPPAVQRKKRGARQLRTDLAWTELLGHLLHLSNAQAVVDGSKAPDYAEWLTTIDSVDCKLIHLVRDPRGVAYSNMSVKRSVDDNSGNMPRQSFVKTALRWNRVNARISRLGSRLGRDYALVRYEDFCTHPTAITKALMDQWGVPSGQGKMHSFSGNPDRLTGSLVIRQDERWVGQFGWMRQKAIEVLCGNLARSYGYRW